MSQLEVDKVIPQSGTTLTLGESGDTVSVPSGATLDASNATLTLPDGSVTAAKLASTAVDNTNTNSTVITGQTAETSIDGADLVLLYDDSASALRKMTRTNFVAGIGGTNTPAFIVRRATSNQSISSGTWTKVQFNSEILDTDNCFDSTTNYRFTPTTPGYYSYKLNLYMDGTSITFVALAIYKNGSTAFISSHFNNTSTVYNGGSVILNMNGTTDYVEGYAYIIATSPVVGTDPSSVFSGYKLIGV